MNYLFKLEVFRGKIGSHDQPYNIRFLNQLWATLLRALLWVSWKTRGGARTRLDPLPFHFALPHIASWGVGNYDPPHCSVWVFREKLVLGCPANAGPKRQPESSLLMSAHPIVSLAMLSPATSSCICLPSEGYL